MKYTIGPVVGPDENIDGEPITRIGEFEIIAGPFEKPYDRRLTIWAWLHAPDEICGYIRAKGGSVIQPFKFSGTPRALLSVLRRATNERDVFQDSRFLLWPNGPRTGWMPKAEAEKALG